MPSSYYWPNGKRFAFTIFDDPDSQTLDAGRAVYGFLGDLGFKTTRGVWPIRGNGTPSDHGITCADPGCIEWLQCLQRRGFEMGFHNATSHTSPREETLRGLNEFAAYFGHNPRVMANHYFCDENVYWGDGRVSGMHRSLYNLLTRWQNHKKFFGHVPGHPYFWGDLCKEKIQYVRNFVYAEINTLKVCPFMPYHDPARPYVNFWYAAAEGANVNSFKVRLTEAAQDRLEEEGGACIMYTHFGHGYFENGALDSRFRALMERLAKKGGWYVPVSTLLDHLLQQKQKASITAAERSRLERRWLFDKIRYGTS